MSVLILSLIIFMLQKNMEEKLSKLTVEYSNIKKEIGFIEPQLAKVRLK